jgi:hypothetical protein
MSEEKIKLSLDYGESSKDTTDLSGKLDMLKSAATKVGGEAFGELVSKSLEVAKSFREVSSAAKEAETDSKLSLGALAEGGQGLFAAFKEGNVGGVIKGVTDLVALIPGVGTFAPAISAAGNAANTAWPLLKEWYHYLKEANDKMVEATSSLTPYIEKLKEANTALKETEGLKQARADDEAETPDAKKKDRADTFKLLMKGHNEDALKETTAALDTPADREIQIEKINQALQKFLREIKEREQWQAPGVSNAFRAAARSDAKRQLDAVGDNTKAQSKAEALLTKAQSGDAGAIEELMATLPEGSVTRDIARLSSPAQQDEDRASKRAAAEKLAKFKDDQRRAGEMMAANEKVQAQIKSSQEGAAAKIIATHEAEHRGGDAVQKDFDERLDNTRRLGNEVAEKGRAQREHRDQAPKRQQVPENASENQALIIMAGNQIGLDAQIRADKQELLRLAREAQANIAKTRSQGSEGGF